MEALHNVLIWVLEIGGVVLILLGMFMWLKVAFSGESTARSFMSLVFTFVFFITVVLRSSEFSDAAIRWITIVYGAVLAFYITARMIEHKEEIRGRK